MYTCDFIAKYLKKRGVKQVFGTPGSDTINLINALRLPLAPGPITSGILSIK